jgi:hypothetical protein
LHVQVVGYAVAGAVIAVFIYVELCHDDKV